ncbi:MAG: dihydrofolate reductase family protein [Verrucomicrobiota bacterium]
MNVTRLVARNRRTTVRPFVFVNMAVTADGKIASANRAVSSFGSARDQQHLYELRAQADAVMCGARTLNGGEIYLGNGLEKFRRLRLRHGLAEYPLRVIVTGSGTINPEAAIFRKRFSPILVLTTKSALPARLKRLRMLVDEIRFCGRDRIDFPDALAWLAGKWGVKRLLCEGGGELNDALFRADLVDELHLTICPLIFGGRQAPTIADGEGVEHLAQAAQLRLKSRRRIGDELYLVFRRASPRPAA